jgi:hypothetical protein
MPRQDVFGQRAMLVGDDSALHERLAVACEVKPVEYEVGRRKGPGWRAGHQHETLYSGGIEYRPVNLPTHGQTSRISFPGTCPFRLTSWARAASDSGKACWTSMRAAPASTGCDSSARSSACGRNEAVPPAGRGDGPRVDVRHDPVRIVDELADA